VEAERSDDYGDDQTEERGNRRLFLGSLSSVRSVPDIQAVSAYFKTTDAHTLFTWTGIPAI
jgi:hypothetical protein